MSNQSKVMVMVGTRERWFHFHQRQGAQEVVVQRCALQRLEYDAHDDGPAGRAHARREQSFCLRPDHALFRRPGPDLDAGQGSAGVFKALEIRPPAGTVEEAFSGRPIPDTPGTVIKVWNITPGRADEPGVLYAGHPAGLAVQVHRPGRDVGHDRGPLRPPAARPVATRRGRAVPAHHRPRPARPEAHVHRHLRRRGLPHR